MALGTEEIFSTLYENGELLMVNGESNQPVQNSAVSYFVVTVRS